MKSLIVDGLPGDPRLLVFLLAFMVIFAVVVAWQYRPANRERNDRLARLPLIDQD